MIASADIAEQLLHASCISIDEQAVLIEGPSGSGKSDIALRLIDRGAVLVSDDYTIVIRDGGRLIARTPRTIAGRIEVRGIGIIEMPYEDDVEIVLIIQAENTPLRMPEPQIRNISGIAIPVIALNLLQSSAPIKAEFARRRYGRIAQ